MDENRTDMTVEIADIDESAELTEYARYRKHTNKRPLPLGAKLIALWNFLFVLAAWLPVVSFLALIGDDLGTLAAVIGLAVVAFGHAAISAAVFVHYKRKYGVCAKKFVLLNAMPLFLLGLLIFFAALVLYFDNDFNFDLGSYLLFLLAFAFLGYSAVYGALMFAVLKIRHKLERKRI